MPCRSGYEDYSGIDTSGLRADRDRFHAQADALTAEADLLRESLIRALNIHPDLKESLDERVVGSVVEKQVEHRTEDLKRLEKVFIELKNTKLLQKVWSANPLHALQPQLGFDPDQY